MNLTPGIHSLAKVVALAVLLAAAKAEAQHPTLPLQRSPSLELTYDYVHTNGPPNNCGCIGLNGGGAAYVYPLAASPVSLVGGITATHASGIGTLGYTLTLVTYTAGARYVPRLKSHLLEPYGEIQVGGVHASGTLASTPSAAGSSIGSAFAATTGGGINLVLHHGISLKLIDAEYLVTNFANGSTNHQNDLRISSGLSISLCRSKGCRADK